MTGFCQNATMTSDSRMPFNTKASSNHHPKRIPLEGTDNFRDLGGYTNTTGQTIRSGLIFRSGHLGKLTETDLKQLQNMNIRKVVDFRGPIEKKQDVNRIPEGAEYVERPIDVAGADMQEEFKAILQGKVGMKMATYLVDVNRLFPRDYVGVFAEWIQDIARSAEALPQVFHCTAGKDRTGFASAILLRILGIDEETVMQDYMLTEELMAETVDGILRHIDKSSPTPGMGEKVRPLLGVHPSFLSAAFDTINEDWGSFDAFVSAALKLTDEDVESLKNIFLD